MNRRREGRLERIGHRGEFQEVKPHPPATRPRMVYADHDPDPTLAPWIANLWTLAVPKQAAPFAHHVPPDGCTNLGFRAGLALIIGPRIEPLTPPVAPGDRWLGVRFRPGAARPFLDLPPRLVLKNRVVRAQEISGLSWALDLANELAGCDGDAAVAIATERLRGRSAVARPPDPAVQASIRLILLQDGDEVPERALPTASELARAAHLSERQLRRRFSAAVDLSPKELQTIWRFRRCAVEMAGRPEPSWSALAAEHGFADQSHLTREFRRLTGLTPGELARQTAAIEHRRLLFPAPENEP